jgi:glyoxylase-like metal-dependent hydrolase (beta-lactamase superfamily II)
MTPEPLFPAHVLRHVADDPDRLVLLDDGPTPLPGVQVRHVGGHTVDSTGWVVRTDAGDVVCCSDTVFTYRNVEQDVPVGANVDLAACYEAMRWAREAGDVQLPCHDPALLHRHPGGVIGALPAPTGRN